METLCDWQIRRREGSKHVGDHRPFRLQCIVCISPKVTLMTENVNKIELNETWKLNIFQYQEEPTVLGDFFC